MANLYRNRVLVCGGRKYAGTMAELDRLHALEPIDLVVHGAALGADTLAEQWAKKNQVDYLGVPAKWKTYGRGAGTLRNTHMLRLRPHLVIAFPGGSGTADMVEQAQGQGIKVLRVTPDMGHLLPKHGSGP